MPDAKIKKKTLFLTELSVLIALIVIMAFTPIGYIKTATGIEITLITIPVIIGAIVLGPAAGSLLGLIFGITSFIQGVTGMSAFGAVIFQLNPFCFFILTIVTRTLMGLLTSLIGKGLKKIVPVISDYVTGLIGALLNTVLFMSALIGFYWNSDYLQGIASTMGTSSIFAFVIAFVGINGLIEMVFSCIVSGSVCKALSKVRAR